MGKNDPGPTRTDGKSWNNKPTRVSQALGKNPDTNKLLVLATRILNQTADGNIEPEWVAEFRASLFEDGYAPQSVENSWSIGPVGAEEIPLPPQVSDLEASLLSQGFPAAANDYKQAFDAFKSQDWEAANTATRTRVEGFLLEISNTKVGYTGTSS